MHYALVVFVQAPYVYWNGIACTLWVCITNVEGWPTQLTHNVHDRCLNISLQKTVHAMNVHYKLQKYTMWECNTNYKC
jgi:hypothetical protein